MRLCQWTLSRLLYWALRGINWHPVTNDWPFCGQIVCMAAGMWYWAMRQMALTGHKWLLSNKYDFSMRYDKRSIFLFLWMWTLLEWSSSCLKTVPLRWFLGITLDMFQKLKQVYGAQHHLLRWLLTLAARTKVALLAHELVDWIQKLGWQYQRDDFFSWNTVVIFL